MSHFTESILSPASSVEDAKMLISAFNEYNPKCHLECREDDEHLLVFSDNNNRSDSDIDNDAKSIIIDKSNLKIIVTQFNKMFYNESAIEFIADKKWESVKTKLCFEGTMIVVFHSHGKWNVSTRKCLDAKQSMWIKDKSYYDLFMSAVDGKFQLDDLDKDNCYQFILLHHLNKNIVSYDDAGPNYKTVVLAITTKKYTLERVDYYINDKIVYPVEYKYNNLFDLIDQLKLVSNDDEKNKSVSTEGIILEYVNDKNELTLLKIQTDVYKYIASIKPNTSKPMAMFIEAYQKNALGNLAPYFSSRCDIIISTVNNAFKIMATELTSLYHMTNNKNNDDLYNNFPKSYKDIRYIIHGKYLSQTHEQKMPIKYYDVYHLLKHADPVLVRQLFIDRDILMDKCVAQYGHNQASSIFYNEKIMKSISADLK